MKFTKIQSHKVIKLGHYEDFDFDFPLGFTPEGLPEEYRDPEVIKLKKKNRKLEEKINEIKRKSELAEKIIRIKKEEMEKTKELQKELNRIKKEEMEKTKKLQKELNRIKGKDSSPIIVPNSEKYIEAKELIKKEYEKNVEESKKEGTILNTIDLSREVTIGIVNKIDFSDGLNDTEFSALAKMSDSKILEFRNYDRAIVDDILNNGFEGKSKTDIAIFQIFAKQNGYYLKSENFSNKIDGFLGKGTRKALKNLKQN